MNKSIAVLKMFLADSAKEYKRINRLRIDANKADKPELQAIQDAVKCDMIDYEEAIKTLEEFSYNETLKKK